MTVRCACGNPVMRLTPAKILGFVERMQADLDKVEIGASTGRVWEMMGAIQSEIWYLRAFVEGRCVLCESMRQIETRKVRVP